MEESQKFAGEDENAGFASPVMDLMASGALIMLSVWIMIESVRLDMPGGLATAPGLLPFLTAGSLCAMAIGLAVMAEKRRREGAETAPSEEIADLRRTLVLVAIIGTYLVALSVASFDYTVQLGSWRLGYGAFEILTIIMLTTILLLYWRKPIAQCLTVAVVWSTLLAAAFRYVFTIPLPGSI